MCSKQCSLVIYSISFLIQPLSGFTPHLTPQNGDVTFPSAEQNVPLLCVGSGQELNYITFTAGMGQITAVAMIHFLATLMQNDITLLDPED